MRTNRLVTAIAVALLTITLSASLTCAEGPTTVAGYQVELINFEDAGPNSSTWTYAVIASGDEKQALSHWTLGLGACSTPVLAPANNSLYTTLDSSALGCGSTYNCVVATCRAIIGSDPTTGIANGIKFEDCSPQLAPSGTPSTQIFQFTVTGLSGQPANTEVAGKAGGNAEKSSILGPSCGPTAVSIDSVSAQADSSSAVFGLAVAALALLVGAGLARAAGRSPRA